jgi:hypothetical protein
VFLIGINGLKRVSRKWKKMKEMLDQDLTEPIKFLKNAECGALR